MAITPDVQAQEPCPLPEAEISKRDPFPQGIPFGQMLSYGANGSPTITMTKTLFAAAATTSTQTSSSSSSQGAGLIVTLTRMSTIFNTITATSTSTTSSSTSSSSVTSADSTTESLSSTKTNLAASATGTFPADQSNSGHSGRVAGSVIGSFAAFGMIGFLLWYFCMKKQGKDKIQAKIALRRRASSTSKPPQLEDQSIEETRKMMLSKQAELNKSSQDVNAFLATATDHDKPITPRSMGPETWRKLPAGRPSMIGVAMTSSTPPNTPPLPRSNSQKSNMTTRSELSPLQPAGAHPMSLMPGPREQPPSASLSPNPPKIVRKPAPIVTAYATQPNGRSPLSPKAMFNAIGNTTNKAWRRASQALSPSGYQRMPPDNHSVFQAPKRRDSNKPRNTELEIGTQMDKGGHAGWI